MLDCGRIVQTRSALFSSGQYLYFSLPVRLLGSTRIVDLRLSIRVKRLRGWRGAAEHDVWTWRST